VLNWDRIRPLPWGRPNLAFSSSHKHNFIQIKTMYMNIICMNSVWTNVCAIYNWSPWMLFFRVRLWKNDDRSGRFSEFIQWFSRVLSTQCVNQRQYTLHIQREYDVLYHPYEYEYAYCCVWRIALKYRKGVEKLTNSKFYSIINMTQRVVWMNPIDQYSRAVYMFTVMLSSISSWFLLYSASLTGEWFTFFPMKFDWKRATCQSFNWN
jgi:hypothetical protein